MACEYTNSRGKKYYLHQKGKLFYFSKNAKDAVDLPDGMTIIENQRTGLPMVKKK